MGRIKTPCFQFISTRGIKKYKIIDQPCCQLMSRIQTSCFLFMRRIKTPCFLFIRRLKTPCFLFMRRIKTPCFLFMIGIKTPCFLFMRRIKPRCFQFMRRIKPPCFLLTIRIKKNSCFQSDWEGFQRGRGLECEASRSYNGTVSEIYLFYKKIIYNAIVCFIFCKSA